MNKVQEFIYDILPQIKNRGEWKCFNCPCCTRMGESRNDYKKRAGIRFDGDGIVYNCFNCKFTWGWSPGYKMSRKMQMFLEDLGLTPKDFAELRELIDLYIENDVQTIQKPQPRIIRNIPDEYKSIKESLYKGEKSPTLSKVYSYLSNRNERLLSWTDIMWAEGRDNFLIPCYEFEKVVGYSLRSLNDNSDHKYIHYIPNGYIFNFDNLMKDRKYQIVVEGQTDALAIDGISILSNIFTAEKLKRLLTYKGDSEIILMPDRDKAGQKMVEQLLSENLPFSVSFPNWERGIKDVEEAVKKYGRLYTLYSIINNKESNKNIIKMKYKQWFNIG
jgi:5S rRNA maturation endonuclease (ribonuclease M5)